MSRISTGSYPAHSIRMTWPFRPLTGLSVRGVSPWSRPLTMTLAPGGYEVTGIHRARPLVSVAQPGESRPLVSVRMKRKAAFFLHMGTSLALINVSTAGRKVVKVLSTSEI